MPLQGDRYAQMAIQAGFSFHTGLALQASSATGWEDCGVAYRGHPYGKNVFHRQQVTTSVISRKHFTATVQPLCYLKRWNMYRNWLLKKH